MINNNFICSEKELFRVNKIHLRKLLNTKSELNNKEPKTPYFLKSKSYLKELIREKEKKRNDDNNMIYKKLKCITTTPSPYSKCNIPKYCPAFDKKRFNFNKIESMINIYKDNISFFNRFSSKKSIYSANEYLKKNSYENYIKHNISRSRFLPKIPLKLCTYRQFKSNLIKESKKIKGTIKKNNIKRNKSYNINLNLYKSKSMNDLSNNNNYLIKSKNNNDNNINNINNLSSNDFNIKSHKPIYENQSRSKSALNKNLVQPINLS